MTGHSPPLHPLLFDPILKAKVWGGRRLASLRKPLPRAAMIGESWELADLDATDPSGGGGDAARSVVANGPLAGTTLNELVRTRGPELLGDHLDAAKSGFPLLLKYLDARENLSVQAHPSPAYAAAHPEAHLKTECWFVIDATPGSQIYRGLRPGVEREQFEKAISSGEVAELLNAIPARPGDFHDLPSGVVHALGAGVLVAEAQTPSDTTFRVFDWGRTGRELHIDKAMECIDFTGADIAETVRHDEYGRRRLAENAHFSVDQINVPPAERCQTDTQSGPVAWMCIRGAASLRTNVESGLAAIGRGDTLLLPASLGTAVCEAPATPPEGEDFQLLEIRLTPRT